MSKKIRVGILCGGKSAEHEVSLQSAKSIAEAIDRETYDVVMIAVDKKGQWHLTDASKFLLNADNPKLIQLNKVSDTLALAPGTRTTSLPLTVYVHQPNALETYRSSARNTALNLGLRLSLRTAARVVVQTPTMVDRVTATAADNPTGQRRLRDVAILSASDALAWSVTGPALRASGVGQDVRKNQPYLAYDAVDFDVPVGEAGDAFGSSGGNRGSEGR